MKYFEFGKDHRELMVMLHGGGVCYRGRAAGGSGRWKIVITVGAVA